MACWSCFFLLMLPFLPRRTEHQVVVLDLLQYFQRHQVDITVESSTNHQTANGYSEFGGAQIQMDAKYSRNRLWSPTVQVSEHEFNQMLRPTTLWHVLQKPVHVPRDSNGRLRAALPHFAVPKGKISYQNLLSKTDSALAPLLPAGTQSQAYSASLFSSDHEEISDSYDRSSISSQFDFESVFDGSYSKIECLVGSKKSRQHHLSGMHVSKTPSNG